MFGRSILPLAVCCLAAACVPLVETYYAPSAEAGEVVRSTCDYLEPADTIEFVSGATKIHVSGSGTGLILRIRVPSGNSVALSSTVLKVQSGGSADIYDLEGFSFTDTAERRDGRVAARDLPVGADEPLLFGKEARIFQSLISFNKTMGDSYKVELPAFSINKEAFHVPQITFTEETGFGVHPINC